MRDKGQGSFFSRYPEYLIWVSVRNDMSVQKRLIDVIMMSNSADISEIARLLKQERFYRDTGRWELCRSAFHPEASKTYINVAWFV